MFVYVAPEICNPRVQRIINCLRSLDNKPGNVVTNDFAYLDMLCCDLYL